LKQLHSTFAQGMTLRKKSIIGLVSLMFTLVLFNLATFALLRGHISSLSSMIDVSVIFDDLKDLTGKETEGPPADIEEYSLHPSAEKKNEIVADLTEIDRRLERLEHETLDDKIRTELGLVANMLKAYRERYDAVFEQISSGAPVSDINAQIEHIKESSTLISEAIKQLISDELDYDRTAKARLARQADTSGFLILSGSVIASVLAFLLFYVYLMKENILQPLERMRHTMNLIANDASDIRLRIQIQQHDEIGILAEYFNRMADTIQKYKEHLEEQVQTRTAQLTQTQAMLVESGKLSALGEMAGGIAHEVNNPLAVIALNCSQLERVLENGQHGTLNLDAAKRFVRNIETTTNRIAKIVKALKTYSRNTEWDPYQKTFLKNVIDDTLALCSEKFKSFGIELRVSCEPPDLQLQCRPTEISQVLLNLLNNAFDEVAHRPSSWVALHAFFEQNHAEIHVTDSGNGIPHDLSQKIFQPFFTTKDIGKGTGLGLSISKGLIEAHGGTLSLDPSCQNTRFVIRLPLIHFRR
jgi:C4-dicarboxylate-specific signal transduction histidine kinase